MKEELLYFIWKFQYFNTKNLSTTQKVGLTIRQAGYQNKQDGADFFMSEIVLDQVRLIGNVELHVKTSDWLKHKHQENTHYDSVILHVVWEHDLEKDILRSDLSPIPTLELKHLVNSIIIEKYIFLKENTLLIPCQNSWKQLSQEVKENALEHLLKGRLKRKSIDFLTFYTQNGQDLEESNYQILAKSFGFKTNAYAFEQLSKSISIKIIQKYSSQLFQIEALLFGQAGFLENTLDDYSEKLKKEYDFLKHKHQLIPIEKNNWIFGKIRPANSPALRIAQFAALLYSQKALVMNILKNPSKNTKSIFEIEASDYWQQHHDFGKVSQKNWAKLGKNTANLLLINVLCPLLCAYSELKGEEVFLKNAMTILENLYAEKNNVMQIWEKMKFVPKSAAQSQALLELYNMLCSQKKCLECPISEHIFGN